MVHSGMKNTKDVLMVKTKSITENSKSQCSSPLRSKVANTAQNFLGTLRKVTASAEGCCMIWEQEYVRNQQGLTEYLNITKIKFVIKEYLSVSHQFEQICPK